MSADASSPLSYLSGDWIAHLEEEMRRRSQEALIPLDSPIDLASYVDSAYVRRDHLVYLSERITKAVHDVEAGRSRYLMVTMPPRMGKSMMVSVQTPLWLLNRHPNWPIMLLSHSPDLAAGWGRQVRRIIEQHPTLHLELAKDAGSVTDWETKQGGGILSKSIRQSVTGRGARVMIIDDPVKDFADAHSKPARDFIWDWWQANSRTRLHPPSLVIVLATRWHEDDMLGRLLSPEYDGDTSQWEIINFPAIAEDDDVLGRAPGDPLLSPLIPDETREQALERWDDIKRAVGHYAFSALFQQHPTPSEGAIFQSDWWNYWTDGMLPDHWDRTLTSWDCAFKATTSSDYVVGQLWGVSGADRYLLKQVRARLTFTETLSTIRQFIANARDLAPDGVYEHLVEDKANGTAVIDTLRREIPGMLAVNPTNSKEARARSITPQIEAGNIYLPAHASWLPELVSEFAAFPNGTNDDMVDATTQALSRLQDAGNVITLVPRARISRGYTTTRGRGRY